MTTSISARKKIIEAHKLGLSVGKTAEYSDVHRDTVSKYWKAAGLKPHFKGGRRLISEETQDLICAAWELKRSARKTAKYSGISHSTVLKYWRKLGLEPHHKGKSDSQRISEETQNLIYAAWELRLSATETATFLRIGYTTVLKYWQKRGLELPPRTYSRPHKSIKVGLTNLLDDVFNTIENPNEQLRLEQILEKLKDRFGTERINVEDLQNKINQLVGWGYYAIVQEGGKTYYMAGMPAAMDGMVKKELVAK